MANKERLHFIGIGGAGMSSLAHVFIELGYPVSGSDIKESANTKNLSKAGASVFIGHAAENLKNADTVVVSSAIRIENPELIAAREQGLVVIQRAQLLARLMEEMRGIAIAGTHGKTTTTSMAAVMMETAGLKPTYLIGGELNDIGSGAKFGGGEYVVAEADESDASLLNLRPEIAVVTNLEADHLDFYESIEDIKNVFIEFLNRIPERGAAIVCADSPALTEILPSVKCRLISYSLIDKDADFFAADIICDSAGSLFDVWQNGRKLGRTRICQPGEHNVANALAVITLGMTLGLDFLAASAGVGAFTGVRRRFQVKGTAGDITVVDDYAHHPSEVAATLKAAKSGNWRKVISVFQPHRYSRTSFLSGDFGLAFADADTVIVTDVYAAGEEPLPGVDGKLIVDSILENEPYKDVAYFPKKSDIGGYVAERAGKGDIFLTMGAGDIWALGEEVLEELKNNEN
jgi:UDP-N-acetylmuramate--alanine ligase